MNLKYIKHANGEVWRVITAFDRGWFKGTRIVLKTKLAQEWINEVKIENEQNNKKNP